MIQCAMEEDSINIAWLDRTDRPPTILHKEIQRRISELNSKKEEDQHTVEVLVKAMEIHATRQLSEFHKIMPVNELFPIRHESAFDLWQQEVMKYLKMLQK